MSQDVLALTIYREIKQCLDGLNSDPDCRVVMLTGAGKNFTAGEWREGGMEKRGGRERGEKRGGIDVRVWKFESNDRQCVLGRGRGRCSHCR